MIFTVSIESDDIESDDAHEFVAKMLEEIAAEVREGNMDGANSGVAQVSWTTNETY